MKISIGKTIENLRIHKNINVTSLIKNIMSRSHYYRMINEETEISAEKLFLITHRLNISMEEFVYIQNNYNIDIYINYLDRLKFLFINKDIIGISNLKYDIKKKLHNTSIKYKHIIIISDIYLSSLQQKKTNQIQINQLKKYFSELEYFNCYEIKIYANIMYVFDEEFNEIFFRTLISTCEKYRHLDKNINETIKIISIRIISLIKRKDLLLAKRYISMLSNIHISNEQINEQIWINFFSSLYQIMTGSVLEGMNNSKKYIFILNEMNNPYAHLLEDLLETTLNLSYEGDCHCVETQI